MSGVFIRGLERWLPLGQRWDNEWLVPPTFVPGSGVCHFSGAELAQFRFVALMYKRGDCSGNNGYIGASDDFE
jgi:hypothetical protein